MGGLQGEGELDDHDWCTDGAALYELLGLAAQLDGAGRLEPPPSAAVVKRLKTLAAGVVSRWERGTRVGASWPPLAYLRACGPPACLRAFMPSCLRACVPVGRLKTMCMHVRFGCRQHRVVSAQPTLVSVPAPAKIFGDVHGQLRDLLLLFREFGLPVSPCVSVPFSHIPTDAPDPKLLRVERRCRRTAAGMSRPPRMSSTSVRCRQSAEIPHF